MGCARPQWSPLGWWAQGVADGYNGSMTVSPSLEEVQRAGFPMGGEPSVAVDFADTLVTVTDPWTDLLADPEAAARWWATQAGRLPAGPPPDPIAVRRLRSAIRD